MREFIIRYFSRVLAILGCSTLVTACYGVPPVDYTIRGVVQDAETEEPVDGIMLRAFQLGHESQIVETAVTESDSDGCFELHILSDYYVDSFVLEWQDLDGPKNGEYSSGTMTLDPVEFSDVVINLSR